MNLTSVTIENSVTSIGQGVFSGCINLTSITIPDSITNIGGFAFYNCNALTEINYNATACDDLSNNNYVFYNAGQSGSGISVNIGANVTKIPALLFCSHYNSSSNLPKITRVTFAQASVCESIGSEAFSHCGNLMSVAIGDNVKSIGDYAFRNCSSLTSITIPESVTSIGNYAFYSCNALTEINYNATACDDLSNNNYVFYNAGQSGSGISVNIGAKVAKIPAYLFAPFYSDDNFPKITSVTFAQESACESVGNHAFAYCNSLTSVAIGDNVTSIGSNAFVGCRSLTSITIPESVTSISYAAFYGCSSLTGVTFEDTTTWYRTSNDTDWQNNTGGTETDVTDASQNATYFTTHAGYYWYKL